MKVIAFSPAHITGFFEICHSEDDKKKGSRGVGMSISLGSYAIAEKSYRMEIKGNVGKGEVTKEALKNLGIKGIRVKIKNDLPFSQGFGISASSSLAAAVAACHLFGIPEERAIEASHVAEIRKKTGLGDVVAAYAGGVEIRKEAGLKGKIEKMVCREKLIIAIVGEEIETRDILSNEGMMYKINEVGNECIKEFLMKKTLENFFDLSVKFSIETGLASEKMQKILKEANKIGRAAMCMLGNSIVAIYSKEMKKYLSRYENYTCFIDNEGARLLASFFS